MIEFKTEKFSGPLGLLLSMIEGEEMDITEIALAKIADDYVSYIKSSDNIDSEEMSDFLVIAAKLLFIKSKALLPYLYTKEDDDEIHDLEKQLKMYKEFISASVKIKDMFAACNRLYIPILSKGYRNINKNTKTFFPPKKLVKDNLRDCFLLIISRLEEELKKRENEKLSEETLEPKISIDEKIFSIRKMLGDRVSLSFSSMLKSAGSRTEIIVSFLAVLELAKQKELFFEQGELFSEILIKNINEKRESDSEII